MQKQRTKSILLSGVLVLACGGEALDVGSNRDPANGNPSPSGGSGGTAGNNPASNAPLPAWPDPAACPQGGDLPMAGVWQGESSGLAEKLRRFVVTIGGSAQTGVCGSVVYGQGSPPPPATDPDTRYPTADTGYPEDNDFGAGGGGPKIWGPMQGVAYSILDPVVDQSSVIFSTDVSELWKGWCALQTPVLASVSYRCAFDTSRAGPNGCFVVDPVTHIESPIDCFKWKMCSNNDVCACNAQQCGAARLSSLVFDLHFRENDAWGTLGGRPVLLQRVE